MLTIPPGNSAFQGNLKQIFGRPGGGASEEQHMLQILGRGAHPDTQLCLVLCAGCVPTKAATWVVAVILFYFILMSV